jgi:hypothetical protein
MRHKVIKTTYSYYIRQRVLYCLFSTNLHTVYKKHVASFVDLSFRDA